jgi:penicillin-binding protein 2
MHRASSIEQRVLLQLANDMGVDAIHDFMKPLGGQITGIDLQGEVRGVCPARPGSDAYKRPEQKKWYAGETISLGIGQGYNNFTMLQLALAMPRWPTGRATSPTWARPWWMRSRARPPPCPRCPGDLGYRPAHVDVVRKAMVG